MSVPVTLLTWGSAAFPIGILIFLLVARRWSVVKAAAVGTLAATVVACAVFDAPLSVISGETGKGVWNSISIIAVIFPAVLIYEISYEIRAFSAIQRDLTRLVPDKLLQIMAIGWCFSSFLQGPSGFGVPIAVTAPLLIGIGVKPFWAVLVPLMAHAWANTFGTLALAWEALVQQSSLGSDLAMYWSAALWTGILTGILCIMAGTIICLFFRGSAGLRHGWPALLCIATVLAGGQLLLTQATPTLSVVIPTTAALGAVFLLARLPRYRSENPAFRTSPMLTEIREAGASTVRLTLHEALLPYYVLVAVSVFVLMTPPVNNFLASWKMSFAFQETVTGYGVVNAAQPEYGPVAWLTHSGFFLLLSSLVTYGYFSSKGLIAADGLSRIAAHTLKKSIPSAVSVMFLLVMSKIMGGSGQIGVLAAGTAKVTGQYYALLAPLVGTLGSFMSSSNVSSNILFGKFQESMAALTGKGTALFLAAQTSGGAVGTMFSPSKVLLGTTTAGIVGEEGNIIRKLLGVSLAAAIVMGVITLIFS